MKKLSQIVTTAFLALSLGLSPMACLKKDDFNLKRAEEVTPNTRISLEGNIRDGIIEKEKEYAERSMEREFYGFTSNGGVYIEFMLFRNKEKKLGEEKNYAYIAYWGDVFWNKPWKEDRKYEIVDLRLEIEADLSEFKKELNKVDRPPRDYPRWGGEGRSFTLHEEDIANKTTLYLGLKVLNLETNKIEGLVYTVKINGKDDEGNPKFKGYSNGVINYQDTDNDPIPSVIVKSEDTGEK